MHPPFFPRTRILAKHIAALLILAPAPAMAATTWTVDTCLDISVGDPVAHTGSLRFAAASASSGDTIDLSQLTCSVISLKNGALVFAQDDIAIDGSGMHPLTITGKYDIDTVEHDRIIRHSGNGWLKINDLIISDGYLDANAYDDKGGCIRSQGNVLLNHVTVSKCKTYANGSSGGGIRTVGALWLLDSKVSDNMAGGSEPYYAAYGGGAYVNGELIAINSTISGNAVSSSGDGGGVFVRGNASIYYSTISGNSATHSAGGIGALAKTTILNSTISGNSAYFSGGLETEADLTIENSTIVMNTAHGLAGVGLRPYQAMVVTMESSLIADNTNVDNGTIEDNDLDRCCAGAQETITFNGARNIVRAPAINLPPGIATTGVCPLLGSLRDNGGPTQTHALLSHSPGIDQGDAGTATYDQRGFFRISGNVADVGAYEVDQDDIIFNNAFDGCP